MGILRTDKISGLETPTAVTGSVSFDGTGDYLSLSSSSDFNYGAGDFTIEGWIYMNSLPSSGNRYSLASKWTGAGDYSWICNIYNDSGNMELNFGYTTDGSTGTNLYSNGGPSEIEKWYHIAYVRDGGTLRQFVNGVQLSTNAISGTIHVDTQDVSIGRHGQDTNYMNGYISNLRILKGTALYTSDFTVPTHELEVIGDTVLLCCNNPDSAGAEATGKAITVNGDAAASTVSPGLTRDFTYGTQFEGVTRFDTQGYFVPPSGTTEQRGRGRGVQGAGYYYVSPAQTYVNTISYYEISTTGNALDFGDLKDTKGQIGSLGSATRGVFAGASQPDVSNAMDYITIASTGNALEFGDMTDTKWGSGGVANSTRGLFAGGRQPGWRASIDYITIAALGNAADFGDLSNGEQNHEMAAASSPTRGVFAGGSAPGSTPYFTNKIDFVTIATLGDAQDFGDLSSVRKSCTGVASQTRMCVGGGLTPGLDQSIEYLTIATTGNTQTFGDLTGSEGRWGAGGTSNSIRGVFGGGYDPSPAASYNTMDYITIASTGNASDFGDIGGANGINIAPGLSDSHGGIS